MNIAFISYEYPPDTAFGGIATYVQQAAAMLKRRGHLVEVFAGTPAPSRDDDEQGVAVHRLSVASGKDFSAALAGPFARRHQAIDFDVVEAPDWLAQARQLVQAVPDIPLVVKLHTPTIIINRAGSPPVPLAARVRSYLGAMRRRIKPARHYRANDDPECQAAREADEIAAPSLAIAGKLEALWSLDSRHVSHVPYPYVPSAALLAIPVGSKSSTVTFLGRLQYIKGVIDLADAVPLALRRRPGVKFRFVGRPLASPVQGLDMRQYLQARLGAAGAAVEFVEPVPLDQVPQVMRRTDLCVFPSLWENFPLVCLEAMAAARAVVGSRSGGMVEMLDEGKAGVLVDAGRPTQLAAAILRLLDDPGLCAQFGEAARRRVLAEYNDDRIGRLQEASYERAIARRRALGPRPGRFKLAATAHALTS